MTHVRLELRTEYSAYEITPQDFDSAVPTPLRSLKGLVFRDETRTVRLATETEMEDEQYGDQCDAPTRYVTDRPKKGTGAPGPCSFYGIGCWIICKNGRPIAIMAKDKLNERYKVMF